MIRTPRSRLAASAVEIDGESWAQYKYFIDSVGMRARFENTVLATDDAAYFAPSLRDWHLVAERVDLDVDGTVRNLRARIWNLVTSGGSELRADLTMRGLPDAGRTRFDVKLHSLRTDAADARRLAAAIAHKELSPGLSALLARAGRIELSGDFNGPLSDFEARALAATDAGTVDASLALSTRQGVQRLSGQVATRNLRLGTLLHQKLLGPVTLAGLAISEAAQRLRGSLAAIYEGLYDGSVKMKLSLGSIRSIQVNVAGEVASSGTYTLPSLATLFHALHMAGGVEQLGTLRSIKVYRGGKLFSDVDVYDYILNGKTDKDIALRDGDLVTVAAYGKLAEVSGEVKRPMFYEMKGSETIGDLVRFAGGFTNDANRKMVSVTRRQGGEYRSFTVDSGDFDTFVLEDGDVVSVAGAIDRYENRVEVKGAVYREGYYAIDDKVNTVKELIARADGLRDDAFRSRALLYREKPDWTMEVQAIDLDGLMAGRVADISLRPNDILMIPAVSEMQEQYDVTIFGSVSRPDTYPYAENMTVEDLVIAAGGLLESASTANVIVTRRVKDPRSTRVSDTLFETFTVNISDALSTDGEGGFVLKPFDQVYVRRSPVYITQSSVTVRGEVTFEGTYPLSHRNMRISEIIGSAGNVTPGAFVEGAYLLRKMTDEERAQRRALREMIEAQAERGDKDSLNMAGVELSTVYSVGIDLEKALAAPGSDADIVLRDGDVISVPTYNGTVRVMGAVLYPNSVTYRVGKKMKYYVNAAGGYDNRARKNRAFVIYMNGMVASGTSAEIRPGCIIIVPSKAYSEPIKWSEVVGLVSSTASTAAVVISVLNLTK